MVWKRTTKHAGFQHFLNKKGEGKEFDALIQKHGGTVWESSWKTGNHQFVKVHKPKTWSVFLRKNSDSRGTEKFLAQKEGFKTQQEAINYFEKQKRRFI